MPFLSTFCDAKLSKTDLLRFWTKVAIHTDSSRCWEWQAATRHKNTISHGVFWFNGENVSAHRLSYILAYGKLKPEEVVRHKTCNNPPCVNPRHLFKGSCWDNNQDTVLSKRQSKGAKHSASFKSRARGTAHGMSKLTNKDVILMRKLRAKGKTLMQLAVIFKIDHTQVGHITRGEQWKHLK